MTSAEASSSASSPNAGLRARRPLSGVFAIDKPSGPTSMSILEELKPLFAQSSLFLNADGSVPESRKAGKKNRRFRGGGGRNAGRNGGGGAVPPKIGQGGTLDPLATGVLVVGVGDGTKKLQTYLDGAKEYLTVGLLGSSTTSYDSQDPILYRAPHSHVKAETLAEHLPSFRGEILQAPPLYSAVRIDGMRLFEYARQGKELPRPIEKRNVQIKALDLNAWYPAGSHSWKEPAKEVPEEEKALVGKVRQLAGEVASKSDTGAGADAQDGETAERIASKDDSEAKQSEAVPEPAAFGLTMSVGGGTYVRSIVHDLAQQVGSAAHVVLLRRTKQGKWQTDRSYRTRDPAGGDGWSEKEELAQSFATDAASEDIEYVKGNCIPWNVFEDAIKKMKADETTEPGEGPAVKKRKTEDGEATTTATEATAEADDADSDGLQEWERILLEHIDAC